VGIAIGPAGRDEIADVVALWTAAGAHPTPTDNAESVEHLLARDETALLVAELDGSVVGTVIAAWNGWRGSLYRIAVLPEHRRRGIATALLREAESSLWARGAARSTRWWLPATTTPSRSGPQSATKPRPTASGS
jgi:ribosomal protein S18 acetylase RimI-like enzyme